MPRHPYLHFDLDGLLSAAELHAGRRAAAQPETVAQRLGA